MWSATKSNNLIFPTIRYFQNKQPMLIMKLESIGLYISNPVMNIRTKGQRKKCLASSHRCIEGWCCLSATRCLFTVGKVENCTNSICNSRQFEYVGKHRRSAMDQLEKIAARCQLPLVWRLLSLFIGTICELGLANKAVANSRSLHCLHPFVFVFFFFRYSTADQ